MAGTDFVTEAQVDGLSAAVVTDTNSIRTLIGALASLNTTDKTSIVNAINEALAAVSGGGVTNLSFTRDATTITVESDTGSDAILPIATTSLAGVLAASDKTKLDGIEASADVTDAGNVGSAIHGAAAKATPIAADELALIDTEASNVLKSITLSQVATYVTALITDGAPAALDTLNELAAALGDDPSFVTTINTALGNRLRVDTAAQGLSGTQQSNGRTNLGIGTSVQDFAADYNAAIA